MTAGWNYHVDQHVQEQLWAAADHQVDVLTQKQYIVPVDGVDAVFARALALDEAARDLASRNPQFAQVWSLRTAARPVVPVDVDGAPAGPVMTDIAALMQAWTKSPAVWPGVPCAEAGLLLLSFTAAGYDVFRGWQRTPNRKRLMQAWRHDGEFEVRDHFGSAMVVGQPGRPAPMMRAFAYDESNEVTVARTAVDAVTPKTVLPWLCWARPTGLKLAAGELARGLGVFVRPALPCLGAPVKADGVAQTVMSWPTLDRLNEPPQWLIDALLAGKRGRPASLAADLDAARERADAPVEVA